MTNIVQGVEATNQRHLCNDIEWAWLAFHYCMRILVNPQLRKLKYIYIIIIIYIIIMYVYIYIYYYYILYILHIIYYIIIYIYSNIFYIYILYISIYQVAFSLPGIITWCNTVNPKGLFNDCLYYRFMVFYDTHKLFEIES